MQDYVWLNDFSQQFLEKDYLLPGQTVDQRVTEICESAEAILKKPGFANKFKSYFKRGWYSFSTPIWANFGTNRGLPISCYGSNVEDETSSILTAQAEISMMSKQGGGTSASLTKLRGRGSLIKDGRNGQTGGAVHFAQLFNSSINVWSQGSTRRGSLALYLDIDHPDIMEWLTIKSDVSPIQDISFGVCVPDYWLRDMEAGDSTKRKIWAKVLETRNNIGYPYIIFIDTVNKNTVDVYRDKKLPIRHSNLCVTGNQLVVTSNGIKRVLDLYKSQELLTLFDNNKSVQASKMNLIDNDADVYEIITTSGRTHKVTDYHKVLTNNGMVSCNQLKPGDRICIQTNEGLFGKIHEPEMAFLLGLYQADGTQTDEQIFIDIWEHDFDLCAQIEQYIYYVYQKNNWLSYNNKQAPIPKFIKQKTGPSTVQKLRLQSAKLKQYGFEKGYIPQWVFDSDKETQSQYLRGLYYADGSITLTKSKGCPASLALANINKLFLQEIQILLSNLGIKSQIYLLREANETLLPDGHGSKKLYKTKEIHRLVITSKKEILKFEVLTSFLARKNVSLTQSHTYRDNTMKFDTVHSVTYIGKEPVYCCTVNSPEHTWICNSIITSNCTEIMLPNNQLWSFVCDLSSLNILYYDEWKNTDAIAMIVYFLNAVMDEFIQKARHIPYMSKPVKFAIENRALGIGWFGWHSYLQSKGIAWESMEAKLKNAEIAKHIYNDAYAASRQMAQEYGEPDLLKGYGRRNTTLIAIAPTTSSSFIIGQASKSIEPFLANVMITDLAKGKFTIKNPFLEKVLKTHGHNDDATWDNILKNRGSVQHLKFLTEHEKNVFKTFSEISPMEIIVQAAQRQKYIDQSQSVNLIIDPATPVKDINSLILTAWKLGVKSLYYQFNVNAAQQLARGILNCTSCES